MRKILVILFGMFFLLGCSTGSAEPEATQREKEQKVLTRMTEDFFIDSVTFDEESKTFEIVSDYHVKVLARAKSGEDLETRNGQTISWEYYIKHYIDSYFNGGGSGSHFSYEISSILGEGYTVKEMTSDGEIIFIAKDGEIIYDILNGYAK